MRFDVSLSALCHRDRNGLQLYDVPVNELNDSTEALCMYPDPQALLSLSSKQMAKTICSTSLGAFPSLLTSAPLLKNMAMF